MLAAPVEGVVALKYEHARSGTGGCQAIAVNGESNEGIEIARYLSQRG